MPARGAEAQKEKARRKAEKRAEREAKALAAGGEERDFRSALDELFAPFRAGALAVMREVVSERMSKIKAENTHLRETAEQAQKVADSRRVELDGQVDRARRAEKQLQANAAAVRDAKDKAEEAIKAAKAALADEVKDLKQIIEEQSSTIRAQARALREAEKAAKV
jgi:hypothetical protein